MNYRVVVGWTLFGLGILFLLFTLALVASEWSSSCYSTFPSDNLTTICLFTIVGLILVLGVAFVCAGWRLACPDRRMLGLSRNILALIGGALLIILVMLIVLPFYNKCPVRAYDSIKPHIQKAVAAYMSDTDGALPTGKTGPVGTYYVSGIGMCNIIDICQIVSKSSGDLLRTFPDGCASLNGSNNDNCDGYNCSGCDPFFFYVWVVDEEGEVYSVCDVNEDGVIAEDGIENVDGYHEGIWP